jgi:subtilisin family serine protease
VDITNGVEQTRGITLSILAPGLLEVTPSEDFESSGSPGGLFNPSSKEYQLLNNGGSSINWSIDKTVDWLDVDPNQGSLDPCESTMVTVSLNTAADSLGDGIYTDTLTFTDTTNNEQETRGVTLSVRSVWVSPGSFDVNIVEGCTLTETLTIANDGIEDLDFMIQTHQVGSSEDSEERITGVLTARGGGRLSIPTGHDFTVASDTPYKPGELIVRFGAKANGQMRSMADKNQILSSVGGGNIKRNFNIVPGLSVVELPPGVTVEEALQTFNKANGILYAEPDYEVQICSTFPDDTRFDDLWGMHNTGQTGGTTDADIDAPEAWDIGTGSDEIIVAVIDTGVDYTHIDLAANMWVNEAEYNGTPGVDDDGNGYVDDIYGYDFRNNDGDPMDDHYHGTHCAGTIGGIGNNGEGVAGVNWDVRIMAVKFLSSGGSGTTSDAISSVEYTILMGANLSSNSWGGGSYSQGLKDAIDAAGATGMLFAASAGNDNEDTDVHPHYPSSYDSESLISVMATDKDDNKAGFSCWGSVSVDLGAPGVDILSCKLGGGYKYASGTSMATPHVAGACALIWSMNSAMSNDEVKDILLRTGDQIPALAGKCVSEGRLNLYQAILETKAPWIEIDPETGTIGVGESNDISVTFDAMELTPGVYEAEIIIISNDPCGPKTIPVTMTVNADDLQVVPAEGFESSGTEGGPFEPECVVYTLTNINGTESVNWTTLETEDWLQITPSEGLLGPGEVIDVNVCISANADLLDPNLYTGILTFQNTDSDSIKPRPVSLTVKPPDCFTESFDEADNDLGGLMVTFSPDGTIAYYEACRERVEQFPTDPNGGTYVGLWDDDFAEVFLGGSYPHKKISFYGTEYNRFYIGSNGYITFGDGDTEFEPSLENHFNLPRISGAFADLNPPNDQCISYKKFGDRVAITYQDVQLFGDKDAKSSFQIELA